MTRLARAVFVLLVAATLAAFFAAQRIKGEPAVAKVRGLAPVFSPNGDRFKDVNRFYIELREPTSISVDVVDAAGEAVRRLVDDAAVGAAEAAAAALGRPHRRRRSASRTAATACA